MSLTAYLGEILSSQSQITALVMGDTCPIQHSGQHKYRIDHRSAVRSLEVVFANGPNNGIFSAIALAEPIVPPVSLSCLSALPLKKIYNNIKDLIGVWRGNGQFVTKKRAAIICSLDNVRLTCNTQ